MKALHITYLLIFTASLLSCSDNTKTKNAVELNNKVVAFQQTHYKNMNKFLQGMEQQEDKNTVEKDYYQMLHYLKDVLLELQHLNIEEWNEDFHKAALSFFETQSSLVQNEMSELFDDIHPTSFSY
jgi:hypothetical protein